MFPDSDNLLQRTVHYILVLHWSYNPYVSWASCSLAHLASPQFAFSILESLHHSTVVPIFDDVVGSIMNLNFNGVTTIIDQEDDASLSISYHGRNLLHSHLATMSNPTLIFSHWHQRRPHLTFSKHYLTAFLESWSVHRKEYRDIWACINDLYFITYRIYLITTTTYSSLW